MKRRSITRYQDPESLDGYADRIRTAWRDANPEVPGEPWKYVESVYSTSVVVSEGDGTYCRVPYTIKDGQVFFGAAEAVTPSLEFVPKAISPDDPGADDDGDPEDEDEQSAGAMVAFSLAPAVAQMLAIDGGEAIEDMHLTLAFLGDAAAIDDYDRGRLLAAVHAFGVANAPIVDAEVTGFGIFVGEDETDCAAVALVDSVSLGEFRTELLEYLQANNVHIPTTHGFIPHVTLAYGDAESLAKLPLPPTIPLLLDTLCVAVGGQVAHVPLMADYLLYDMGPVALAKADDARRYTLSPLYVPDAEDSHGDYATADDLEAAVWEYMRASDFTINLQHLPGTRAGECVGIMSWPYEVTCKLVTGDGVESDVTLPPGTIYQGVVWEPWAYEMAKSGKIRALSMEGLAFRMDDEDDGSAPAA